jgi:ABC-type Fe3+ transport system permease subunit
MLAAVCIALPGPIISLGVLALLNHNLPPFDYLYDRTLLPPILAVLVRVVPMTFAILWWGFRTLEEEPLLAAALDGASPLRQLQSIALPQRWQLLLAAALAAFVVASGDISASLLVLRPGPNETIGRSMFGLIHVGADDQVAAIALICWFGYFVAAGTVVWLLTTRIPSMRSS